MTGYSVYLQEDYAEQEFYPKIQNETSWFCFEDVSSQSRYMLATSKKCGLLILIDKLLSDLDLQTESRQKQRKFLAENLIRNFHKTTIRIHDPNPEDVLEFIEKMIHAAETVVSRPNDYHVIVNMYAKRLVNVLNSPAPEHGALERIWDNFTISFLQEKL